jgi:hypothetical protein
MISLFRLVPFGDLSLLFSRVTYLKIVDTRVFNTNGGITAHRI